MRCEGKFALGGVSNGSLDIAAWSVSKGNWWLFEALAVMLLSSRLHPSLRHHAVSFLLLSSCPPSPPPLRTCSYLYTPFPILSPSSSPFLSSSVLASIFTPLLYYFLYNSNSLCHVLPLYLFSCICSSSFCLASFLFTISNFSSSFFLVLYCYFSFFFSSILLPTSHLHLIFIPSFFLF